LSEKIRKNLLEKKKEESFKAKKLRKKFLWEPSIFLN
jgi:hypothetical protein